MQIQRSTFGGAEIFLEVMLWDAGGSVRGVVVLVEKSAENIAAKGWSDSTSTSPQ